MVETDDDTVVTLTELGGRPVAFRRDSNVLTGRIGVVPVKIFVSREGAKLYWDNGPFVSEMEPAGSGLEGCYFSIKFGEHSLGVGGIS